MSFLHHIDPNLIGSAIRRLASASIPQSESTVALLGSVSAGTALLSSESPSSVTMDYYHFMELVIVETLERIHLPIVNEGTIHQRALRMLLGEVNRRLNYRVAQLRSNFMAPGAVECYRKALDAIDTLRGLITLAIRDRQPIAIEALRNLGITLESAGIPDVTTASVGQLGTSSGHFGTSSVGQLTPGTSGAAAREPAIPTYTVDSLTGTVSRPESSAIAGQSAEINLIDSLIGSVSAFLSDYGGTGMTAVSMRTDGTTGATARIAQAPEEVCPGEEL